MSEGPGVARYPHVFQPLKLGPVEVWNRIYIPPHGLGSLEVSVPGHETYGLPSAEHAHYYAERAAGGASLIFQSMKVAPFGAQAGYTATPWFKEAIPAYRRIAELVHENGAKIMAEIFYSPRNSRGWEPLGPEMPIMGASIAQSFGGASVRKEMTRDEMRRFVDAHVVTTRHLREAGYDGVEVHASHGVILEHFLSPYFNRRTDEYGGSIENRMRLLIEALEAVRSETGSHMAVGMRLNADELVENGLDEAANREILELLAPTGLLDFVDLDVSVEPEQARLMTTSFFEPKLHNAQRVANVSPAARPSMVVLAAPGRVTHMAEAESFLASGATDMVGIVRGHIAEPRLVRNALEGIEHRSRICIAANHCAGRSDTGFGCAINAAAAKEERFGLRKLVPAPETMRVVVVGAGPAGLEAARIAALRGHAVSLFERRPRTGGALALWARIPGREHLATLPTWFNRQLRELGVDVQTGIEADAELVLRDKPDVVVVATGAHYSPGGESGFRQTPVPGWDHELVIRPEPVLEGERRLSGRVVVLDEEGMHAAAGVAEIAAEQGAQVEYVTRQMIPAAAVGATQVGYVVSRMLKAGVTISTSTYIRRIEERAVILYSTLTSDERTVDADTVVLATMRTPLTELADALEGAAPYVYVIGDTLAPRTLREATYEGHRFGRVIGEPDMPASVMDAVFEPVGALRAASLA